MHSRVLRFGLVLACLAVFCLGGTAAAADKVTLRYSNFFPPTHIQSQLAEAWCKEVEKRTEGRVTIEYFPGQTLTKGTACYDGVVNGLSDLGFSLLPYTPGRFPVMEVTDLPIGHTNGRAATAVINEVYQTLKPKELDDTKVMYLHAHGPGLLFTRKKAVHKMEDLKGLKIRGHGTSIKIIEALGGTPVGQPMPELYQLLQKGVVDGALYPMEVNDGWKMAEVVEYGTQCYSAAYSSGFFVVMNKDKWASLSKADQEAIEKINQEWIPKHGEAWDASDQKGRDLMEKQKRTLIVLTPEESARWGAAVKPVLEEWVKKTAEKGLDGAQALKTAQDAMAKYAEMYK